MAQLTFRKGDCPANLTSSCETHLGEEVRERKSGVRQLLPALKTRWPGGREWVWLLEAESSLSASS